MTFANVTSGSYQPSQHISLSHLELSQTFLTSVSWSSGAIQEYTRSLLVQMPSLIPNFGQPRLTAARFEASKSERHIIKELSDLQDNWDGYGASAISEKTRDNALRFISVIEAAPFNLPALEISPKPTGTISFEWETSRAEAYLEIGTSRYSGFIDADKQEPIFIQGEADSLDQQVLALIQSAFSSAFSHSATVTEIHTAMPWHELLAA